MFMMFFAPSRQTALHYARQPPQEADPGVGAWSVSGDKPHLHW